MSNPSALGVGEISDAAPLFAALGDPTRLQLLAHLAAGGPGSIAGLSAKSQVTRQAITKHLLVLAGAGLVTSQRRGRESVWTLEARRFASAHDYLQRISRQWDDALDRLRALVEEDPQGN